MNTIEQITDALASNQLQFPDELFPNVSENAKDLMTKMLPKDPDSRMTAM